MKCLKEGESDTSVLCRMLNTITPQNLHKKKKGEKTQFGVCTLIALSVSALIS